MYARPAPVSRVRAGGWLGRQEGVKRRGNTPATADLVNFFTSSAILLKALVATARFWIMAKREDEPFVEKSLREFQDTVQKAGPAATASYGLIGAILLLGGIGYAVDSWRGTWPWGLLAGLMLGLIVGFYELARTVWKR